MTDRELMQQALEALTLYDGTNGESKRKRVLTALRERLAQPQQEPVAWQERQAKRMSDGLVTEWTNWYPCRYRTIEEARAEACDHIPYEWRPLYTSPPPRQPLTEDMAKFIAREFPKGSDDWACKHCHPESEILKDGFVCVVHRAIEAAHGIKENT